MVKGGKKRAVISPKPKKAVKKGKKAAAKTLLKDSETVGSTTTPPKDADVEGEVNQDKEMEKAVDDAVVSEKVETENVEKILGDERLSEKVSEVEVPTADKVLKSTEIITQVCKDIQE
ncbi:hypothetical protein Dimus_038288 [Dionaea muscipula]